MKKINMIISFVALNSSFFIINPIIKEIISSKTLFFNLYDIEMLSTESIVSISFSTIISIAISALFSYSIIRGIGNSSDKKQKKISIYSTEVLETFKDQVLKEVIKYLNFGAIYIGVIFGIISSTVKLFFFTYPCEQSIYTFTDLFIPSFIVFSIIGVLMKSMLVYRQLVIK